MRFTIVARLKVSQRTVGYRLVSNENRVYDLKKENVLKLAFNGQIENADYSTAIGGLVGKGTTDLRGLPSIQTAGIESSSVDRRKNSGNKIDAKAKEFRTTMPYTDSPKEPKKSNIQLAKDYIAKCLITTGSPGIKVNFLNNDRVQLVDVLDKESTGTFVMPTFVTEHQREYSGLPEGAGSTGPFTGCKFNKIIIRHPYVDWSFLFINMRSNKLVVEYSGPVQRMKAAFCGCFKLSEIDLCNLDTSYVTDMADMFEGCENLLQIHNCIFDIGKVVRFEHAFRGCSKLTSIRFKGFNPGIITNMRGAFAGCSCIKEIDLKGFDTSNVLDMEYMLLGCGASVIDLSHFNTKKVRNMASIFSNCKNLIEVDISGFDTRNAQFIEGMFHGCKGLIKVICRNQEEANKMREQNSKDTYGTAAKFIAKAE